MLLSALREYDVRDYDHEVRAQYPNPVGTPKRHRIKSHRFKLIHGAPRNGEKRGNNMATKKAAETEAKPKAAKKKEAPTRWGTKDVAKQLGVDPKFFRAVLRANGRGADGQRYDWPIGDPLKKERQLIADYQKKQAERKANAESKAKEEKETAKKGAGKAKKAVAKKTKKAAAAEPEEEEAEEEEAFEE